jgi:hypothetical protein
VNEEFHLRKLPHYHMERGDSHVVFRRWAEAAAACAASSDTDQEKSPIVGVLGVDLCLQK